MNKNGQQGKSVILRAVRGLGRFLDFCMSIGPMLIGLVVGAVVGFITALVIGLPIIANMLVGAAVGFLLVVFIQAMIIGGG